MPRFKCSLRVVDRMLLEVGCGQVLYQGARLRDGCLQLSHDRIKVLFNHGEAWHWFGNTGDLRQPLYASYISEVSEAARRGTVLTYR